MAYKPHFNNYEFRGVVINYEIPNVAGRRVLYTYIRKNACTSFVNLIRSMSGTGFGRKRLASIQDCRIFRAHSREKEFTDRIFVYREPFDRCVSAFLNKFVQTRERNDAVKNFEYTLKICVDDASFQDVAFRYVQHDFSLIDPHFWPQKSYLGRLTYTAPIALTHLFEHTRELFGKEIAKHFFYERVNSSRFSGQSVSESLVSVKVSDLRNMLSQGIRIQKRNFFDEAVFAAVRFRYADDYLMVEDIERDPILSRSNG